MGRDEHLLKSNSTGSAGLTQNPIGGSAMGGFTALRRAGRTLPTDDKKPSPMASSPESRRWREWSRGPRDPRLKVHSISDGPEQLRARVGLLQKSLAGLQFQFTTSDFRAVAAGKESGAKAGRNPRLSYGGSWKSRHASFFVACVLQHGSQHAMRSASSSRRACSPL